MFDIGNGPVDENCNVLLVENTGSGRLIFQRMSLVLRGGMSEALSESPSLTNCNILRT